MISVSILSKYNESEEALEEALNDLNELDIDAIHLDVMDGKFVKNKTFDYSLFPIKTNKIIDTHLMIEKPIDVIDQYLAYSDIVTIHLEAVSKEELLNFLLNKPHNKKIGLSIKPNTQVSEILPYLPYLDLVLVMSVEPGEGGQTFMNNALIKIQELDVLRKEYSYNYIIEVDGGINSITSKLVRDMNCDMIVVGTYFFKNKDYQETINSLRS